MEASELRIGNWYKEDIIGGEYAQITPKDIQDLFDDPLDDFYKPITITEEWLLKFGFEKSDFYKNFRVKAGDYYNSVQYIDKTWFYSNDSSDAGCYVVADFKYVHQLQNLYFALTGDELTFKSK